MLGSFLVSCLALAGPVFARPGQSHPASPAAPALKYLFTVNITSGVPSLLGETPAGQRVFEPIAGGTFSGPGIQGKVVGGLDSGVIDSEQHFTPDVVMLLQTHDGVDILVRETGRAPNVFQLFETSSNATTNKYDYLNDVVAYGKAAQVTGGVVVDVWKVGLYAS